MRGQQPATRAETILAARAEKAKGPLPPPENDAESKIITLREKIFDRLGEGGEGLAPKFGGLQTGQGRSLGLRYRKSRLGSGPFDFQASGVVSVKRSQRYNMRLTAPRLFDERVELTFEADHRNLTQVDYYGPGPDSSLEDRTSFRHEHLALDASAAVRPYRNWLVVGGGVGYSTVNTGPGRRAGLPSTDRLFSPAAVPGLGNQSNFLRTYGSLAVDYRKPTSSGARNGGYYTIELAHFEDVTLERHDFQQLDIEAQQFFGFFENKRVFVLRGRTTITSTDGDQSVPFYWQPWLGGPHELRGFRNYRFYDNNAMVLNAEYRFEAFSGLDLAVFADAGKVAARRADLDLSDLQSDVGFGFRFNGRNKIFLRLDVAFSHEGAQVWFRFGGPFRVRR